MRSSAGSRSGSAASSGLAFCLEPRQSGVVRCGPRSPARQIAAIHRARAAQGTLIAWILCAYLQSAVSAAAVRLAGHVPYGAMQQSVPLGAMPPAAPVRFAFALPLRNQAALTDLIDRLYDPQDPLYGHYLTPAEFTERFGPTQADYDAVASFAQSAGLTIVGTHPNRVLLDVEGSAAAVQRAFALDLLQYQRPDGRVFRAPDADPLVPDWVASRIAGVVGLDTASVRHPHLRQAVPPAFGAFGALATPGFIGTGPGGGLAPSDIKTAYGLSGVSYTGAGQTLAVFELDGYTASDIKGYETHFGLPDVPLQNVLVDGASGSAGGGAAEVTLDIELQIALAPGASKVMVYEGPNTDAGVLDTYNMMATDNAAKQMSTSWGIYELSNSTAFLNSENTIFQQMATQGQSIYAAAGDSGAYDNYSYVKTPTLSVDDPGSQPYMVSVGGTALTTNGAGGAWLSETTWNDGSSKVGAGGGGVSAVWPIPSYQSQSGVITSLSGASSTYRNVPDVSLDAEPNTGYAIYLNGSWQIYGGTSCAAPLWAAFTAMVNQARLAGGMGTLGFANPTIYSIGVGPAYTSSMHDIADGSTNLYYKAVPGYDLATGWGTLIGSGFFSSVVPRAVGTQVIVADEAGMIGHAATLSATLERGSDGSAISGETLTFAVDGTTAGSATTNSSGVATLSYVVPLGASAGSRAISVTHAATSIYGASSGSATLTVLKANVAFSLSPSSGLPGQTVTLKTLVYSGGAPVSGLSIQFAVNGTSVGTSTSGASNAALSYTIPTTMAAGVYDETVTFAGNAWYNSASRSAAALTVGKANIALSLRAANGVVGQAATLKTLVYSGGAPVSGLPIQFSVNGTYVGTATSGTSDAGISYTIPTTMAPGLYSVTVSFAGNSSYNSASRSATALTVQQAGVSLSLCAASGSPGQTVTLKTLVYSGGAPVSGLPIEFSVNGTYVGTATSGASDAALSYTIPAAVATGLYNVTVTFAGNTYYHSATRTASALTVN